MYELDRIQSEQSDQLIEDLNLLCAQPSSSGHMEDLNATARIVAELLRRIGLHVRIIRTPGAPIIIGWREGQHDTRLLLYHHYDVAPPGPWRAWFHEPFRLAERDEKLYGRGVAHGKGALAAHLQALRSLLRLEGEFPCGVAVVVEGEGLSGSPYLAEVLAQHADELRAEACLGVAGEHDSEGTPFCYGGSKGLLRVRLSVRGADHPLSAGLAASTPNPAWRLTWALNHIKGEDEDIRINGFYDAIAGPGKGERELLRSAAIDEQGRLDAWQIPAFLFGMSGTGLVRSEITLPTCNISSFAVETSHDIPSMPVAASAQLDFQLVPDQHPEGVLQLLRKYLHSRSFDDIEIEALPGGYAPVRTPVDQPFIRRLAIAGERVYGKPLPLLPVGAFAQPLQLVARQFEIPVAALALAHYDSALFGANENLRLKDYIRHGQLLAELLLTYNSQPDPLEVSSSS